MGEQCVCNASVQSSNLCTSTVFITKGIILCKKIWIGATLVTVFYGIIADSSPELISNEYFWGTSFATLIAVIIIHWTVEGD